MPEEQELETTEITEEEYLEEEPEYPTGETEEEVELESEEEFSDQHYAVGAKFGLTPEQVDGFGTSEVFEGALGRLEAIARSATEGQNTQPVGEEAEVDDPVSAFQFSDPAEYDPEIVDLADQSNRRFDALEKRVGELMSQNQFSQEIVARQNAEQNVMDFEGAVNQLDESIFGRGGFDEVGSQHSNNRMKLAQAVARLGHGYSAQGEDVPSIEKLVEEAFPATFTDQIGKEALKTAASKSRRQRGQSVAAPTSDSASGKTSTEAAIQAAADWFKENGKR